jgi:hypothetical protein
MGSLGGADQARERLKFVGARTVADAIQTASSASQKRGNVAAILVENEGTAASLAKRGLIGNILVAEENDALFALQILAAMRLSQRSAVQVTDKNWPNISAILLKEFGQGAFRFDRNGYLVLDNKVLAALERVLSDIIAIQATSASA